MEGTIYLLDKCNLSCKHCYAGKKGNELSLWQIGKIKEYSTTLDIDKFALLGGEPLLYENLDKVVEMLPNVSIYTNGLLVKKHIDLLKKMRCVFVSIDGYNEYSESIRGKGTWKAAMDAINLLKKEMPKLTDEDGNKLHNILIRSSYSSENLADVKLLIEDISIPLDIPIIFLPRIDKPPLTTEEQINLYTYIMGNDDTGSYIHQPNFFQYIGKNGRCPAGDYRINFCSDGFITPCNMSFDYKLGEIGMKAEVIKQNISVFLEHFKLPPMECSACPKVKVCKGGCRVSQAYMGCPLRHQIDLKVIADRREIDLSRAVQRFDNIKQIIHNVVTC